MSDKYLSAAAQELLELLEENEEARELIDLLKV